MLFKYIPQGFETLIKKTIILEKLPFKYIPQGFETLNIAKFIALEVLVQIYPTGIWNLIMLLIILSLFLCSNISHRDLKPQKELTKGAGYQSSNISHRDLKLLIFKRGK